MIKHDELDTHLASDSTSSIDITFPDSSTTDQKNTEQIPARAQRDGNGKGSGGSGKDHDLRVFLGFAFQIVLWLGIVVTSVLVVKGHTRSPLAEVFITFLKEAKNSDYNALLVGVLGSVLATIVVLLTRIGFYSLRDRLPAQALFAGIAHTKEPLLIFTLRMKDTAKMGEYLTPLPDYSNVCSTPESNRWEGRQATPWVTSVSEAQALAHIFHVLGGIGRTENIEVTFADKDYDRWDSAMIILGGSWKATRAFENCNPHFIYDKSSFRLGSTGEEYKPCRPDDDMGLLQKMINPTTKKPVWVVMGYRGAGTTAASYALDRWWKYLGVLFGKKPFGLLVSHNDKDGWQQSSIVRIYPTPSLLAVLRHPLAWSRLRSKMKKYEGIQPSQGK